MIKGLLITLVLFHERVSISLAQSCSFTFSNKGYETLKCMEGFVDGGYFDSQCYWTIWWGHLIDKSKSKSAYESCCALRSNQTPVITLKKDVEGKVILFEQWTHQTRATILQRWNEGAISGRI
jgi:GH24 family phage-related lysozyme (muramidase)